MRALCLNESPPKKEGKCRPFALIHMPAVSLNESPPKKEGKCQTCRPLQNRKSSRLNESPSQKEGKSDRVDSVLSGTAASMKVPTKP